MPLEISPNEKEIIGIYKGQVKPRKLPSNAESYWSGPHFIVANCDQSAVTLEAFFDPSKSELIEKNLAGNISYIQIGEFFVNGLPIPLSEYLPFVDVPVVEYKKRRRDSSFIIHKGPWLDVPQLNWDGLKNEFPFFLQWSGSKKSGFNFQDTYSYPQEYGATVKVNENKIQQNEYLVSYLRKFVTLELEKFESNYDPNVYLANINIEDLVRGGRLTESFKLPEDQNRKFTEEEIKRFEKVHAALEEVKSQVSERLQVTAILNGMLFGTQNRVYAKFKGHSKIDGKDEELLCEVLVYPIDREEDDMDDGEQKFAWSFLDEDSFQDEIDYNLVNGPINRKNLIERLAGNGHQLSAMKNKDETAVSLAYRITTFACQWYIKSDPTEKLYIRVLEGFRWEATREFHNDKDASDISIKGEACNSFSKEEFILKDTVSRCMQQNLAMEIVWF